MTPRLIRFKDAPKYLAMDRHCFNREVRPYVAEIRLSKQGVAFDRFDLDDWVTKKKKLAEPKIDSEQIEITLKENIQNPQKIIKSKESQRSIISFQEFANTLLAQHQRYKTEQSNS
jgi:predicted DNA-binding transcriptional regulator AlpA